MEEPVRYPFSNNRVFIKTMQNNPDLCCELVERILGFEIEEVISITVEDTMASINNKMPRLDLVLKTPDKVIDVEMQCSDVPALGRRMRYYQAMADVRSLPKDKAENYDRLPDIYVIFLCTIDILKAGLPMYRFYMTCEEDARVGLGDGMHYIVVNANAFESCEDEKMRMLLKYVKTDIPNERDELTMKIAEAVEKAQEGQFVFPGFMTPEMDMRARESCARAEGEAIGFERGAAEGESRGEAKEQSREQALIAAMKSEGLGDTEILEFLTDLDRKSVYVRFGIE